MNFQFRLTILLIFILSISSWICSSLKLTSTTVPYYAVLDREETLYCHFDLGNDTLFVLKWYKDGHEFFRYMPREVPPITIFPVHGVFVSENRSSLHKVQLERITLESKGDYRCEISADAPSFQTLDEEKFMRIMVLPPKGPKISGVFPWYNIGDNLTAQCNYSQTFPEAKLTWIVNNEQVDAHECKCIDFESSSVSSGPEDPSLHSSSTEIRFPIDSNYFRDGTISIECKATFSRSSVELRDVIITNVKSGLGLQYAMQSGNYANTQQLSCQLGSMFLLTIFTMGFHVFTI